MTKKLLFQFDTDSTLSTFDAVVAYDSDVDRLIQVANVNPENCQSSVEGTIYTRAPKNKKNTAIFIGGNDLVAGQNVLNSVTQCFFDGFRVSVMLDSSGCNTTAAAAVALVNSHCKVKGKRAIVLAGTGPVGQRIGAMLAFAGAQVRITSRTLQRATQACDDMNEHFNIELEPLAISSDDDINAAIKDAQLVFATGKSGICLLRTEQWQDNPNIEALADVNTQPPAGIDGIEMVDKASLRYGKKTFGGIGIGALKLKLHRACVRKLFTANDLILDAENIFSLAQQSV